MTLKAVEVAAEIFGYDIEIDGDTMQAHCYINGLYSHSHRIV